MPQTPDVAATIYQQLGHGTIVMLGAFHLQKNENSLAFRFRGSRKANHLRIELEAGDTYRMIFTKIRPRKFTFDKVYEESGLYFDQLHATIEEVTGLATRLPRVVRA